MGIHSRLFFAVATILFAATTTSVRAEVSEVSVAQQYGVSFLPLMWMEHNKLIEKHAKARRARRHQGQLGQACRPRGDERRAAVGLAQFQLGRRAVADHAVGQDQRQHRRHGRVGADHVSALSQRAQSEREVDQGFHRQGQDRGAGGQGVDAGDHAADGGRESVRRGQSLQARSVHRHAVASGRHGGADVEHRRRRRAFHDFAVSRAGDEDSGRAHADDFVRDTRRARDRAGARDDHQIPRSESENV